jgi:hypothetical protein
MNGTRTTLLAAVASAALLAGGPAGPGGPGVRTAEASVPTGTPAFSDPLTIDNPLFPLSPGSIKVFRGKEGSRRITVIERHLEATRTFDWNGGSVTCRILQDMKFEGGTSTEVSHAFYAQADDGSVYCFGEIALPPGPPPVPPDGDDEPLDTESDSWVVGLVAPGDPPTTTGGAEPAVAMPADPRPGDLWKPEDFLPVVDESLRAMREGVRMRVPAGAFRNCLQVRETTVLDPGFETKWYAPGIGVIRQRGRGEELRLQAGTILKP